VDARECLSKPASGPLALTASRRTVIPPVRRQTASDQKAPLGTVGGLIKNDGTLCRALGCKCGAVEGEVDQGYRLAEHHYTFNVPWVYRIEMCPATGVGVSERTLPLVHHPSSTRDECTPSRGEEHPSKNQRLVGALNRLRH